MRVRSEAPGSDLPQLEGYENLHPLGEGGFSKVYRAVQSEFGREVAVKVLNTGINDERERAAFERECRAMGVVSQHPNMVTVYSALFTASRQTSIVMELYDGGTMSERLKSRGPLDLAEALSLGVQLCAALQAAHDRGLLHRDIKPNNIFVSTFGQPALGDFGISSFTEEQTITGGSGLTIHYAPPEVLEGESASARSDIYSLAASVYTVFAGRRPFDISGTKGRMTDVAMRVLRGEAPLMERGASTEFENVIRRAMAKNPSARYGSAADFGKALQKVQRASGIDVTTMLVAEAAPSPDEDATIHRASIGATSQPFGEESSLAVEKSETQTATVARLRPSAPAIERTPDEEHAGNSSRRALAFGLPILALVVIGAAAMLLGGGGDDDPVLSSTTSAVAVAPDDDFLVSIPAPENLTVAIDESDPTSLQLSWDEVDGAARYQVEPTIGLSDDPRSTQEPMLTWQVEATGTICFAVQAVSDGGRLSNASEAACTVRE